jgi:hypothetical protein
MMRTPARWETEGINQLCLAQMSRWKTAIRIHSLDTTRIFRQSEQRLRHLLSPKVLRLRLGKEKCLRPVPAPVSQGLGWARGEGCDAE